MAQKLIKSMKLRLKIHPNRYVFNLDLKSERLRTNCNSTGKEFQSSTIDINNDLPPTVLNCELKQQTRMILLFKS